MKKPPRLSESSRGWLSINSAGGRRPVLFALDPLSDVGRLQTGNREARAEPLGEEVEIVAGFIVRTLCSILVEPRKVRVEEMGGALSLAIDAARVSDSRLGFDHFFMDNLMLHDAKVPAELHPTLRQVSFPRLR